MAIDRATRLLFYRLYDEKSAENAADFLTLCKEFFPFEITTVLTDNGKEFSNKLFKGRSGAKTEKEGKLEDTDLLSKNSKSRRQSTLVRSG